MQGMLGLIAWLDSKKIKTDHSDPANELRELLNRYAPIVASQVLLGRNRRQLTLQLNSLFSEAEDGPVLASSFFTTFWHGCSEALKADMETPGGPSIQNSSLGLLLNKSHSLPREVETAEHEQSEVVQAGFRR